MNKQLTKKECEKALNNFWNGDCNNYLVLENLINEHFELKEKHEKLVDKTTPKKVISTNDYRVTICPNCNESIDSDVEYESRLRAKQKKDTYCLCCGQALDWSEEDE